MHEERFTSIQKLLFKIDICVYSESQCRYKAHCCSDPHLCTVKGSVLILRSWYNNEPLELMLREIWLGCVPAQMAETHWPDAQPIRGDHEWRVSGVGGASAKHVIGTRRKYKHYFQGLLFVGLRFKVNMEDICVFL